MELVAVLHEHSQENLTNETTQLPPDKNQIQPRPWTLFLSIFILITLAGNTIVVCAVFKTKALRSVTNYLVVSLAIADILVGTLVMSIAVYVEVSYQCLSMWN